MFRIESYVTSLILSYVDRFIKNFRRQDAQVSLWEGDGMFHNLDLDLEALEKELQLPFTFISGHIHELLIHVPWTRIGSESVSVTINTIECVVKLKPPGSEGKQSPTKSRKSQIEDEVTPPSSMSAFISKILYNVSVTCNNIILKYVEEDIVFSMNVKTLSMQSVNEDWEPEFLDMNPAHHFLRKLMTVSDITICLDKRNASGRIESFLEPLLYRCSMTIRMCRFQPNSKSRNASFTRLDIFCSAISFTLSEPQVTMLMRLLVLALSLRQQQPSTDSQECLLDDENKSLQTGSDKGLSGEEIKFLTVQNLLIDADLQSWGGWLWSWVPTILPQNESDEPPQSPLLANFSHRLHLGIYIDSLSCVVKLESRDLSKSTKKFYQSYLQIWLNGSFFNVITMNANWLNAQFGVSHISIEPLGDCCCGSSEINQVAYFSAGRIQQDFLNGSLFKNGLVIPDDLPTDWNEHLLHITETLLLERTPAFAVDYLCVVQNAHVLDINEEEHNIDEEKVLTRIIVGPLIIRLNSGLIHRIQRIHSISTSYDYQPYYSLASKQDSGSCSSALLPKLTEEQLLCLLGGNIPQSVYQFTVFNPVLEIYAASHPPVSSARQRKTSKVQKRALPGSPDIVPPRFTLEWQCLDAKMTTPLRMKQIVYTLLALQEKLPNSLLQALQTFISIKVLGLGSSLIVGSNKAVKVLEMNNVSVNLKLSNEKLLMTADDISRDLKVEIESIIFMCSKASVIIYYQIITSLMFSNHKMKLHQCLKLIYDTTLLTDVQIFPGAILLDLSVYNIQTQCIETKSCFSSKFSVEKLQAFIEKLASDCNTCYKAMIFGVPLGPENNRPIFEVVFQIPLTDDQHHPPILCFTVRHMQMTVDPLFYAWLLYYPSATCSSSKKSAIAIPSSGLLVRKVSESSLSASQVSKPSAPPVTIQQDSALSSSGRETATPSLVTHSTGMKASEPSSEMSWTELFISKFSVWKGLVISGDVSQLMVYFPRTSFEDNRDDKSNPITMEQIIQFYLSKSVPSSYSKHAFGSRMGSNFSNLEVVIFKLPSITIRCNGSKTSVMECIQSLPIKLPDYLWVPGKLNFPWNLEISDLHCMTFSNGIDMSLLKPVSATCTIGISPRNATNDTSLSSLALIIHCDMSPVTVSISELQVKMLAELLLASFAVYGVLFGRKMNSPFSSQNEDIAIPEATAPVIGSEESRSVSAVTKDISNNLTVAVEDSSQKVKLTAWLQLVLARFTLIMSTVPSPSSTENLKLVLEVEDIITSMDIQQVYYKIKLKIASSCIQYYTRDSVKHPWKQGKFLGLVMRNHNSDSTTEISPTPASNSASMPFAEDSTNLSRFLVATLTIASCSHLHSKISDANSSNIFNEVIPHQSYSNDRFITELILKIQPIDFVFSPCIIGKFLNIILPLLNVTIDHNVSALSSTPGASDQNVQSQSSFIHNLLRYNFPMLYIDMMNVRLIMPRMFSLPEKNVHDCIVFELDSVSIAPQPDNPLCRTPLRADLYHIAEKHHILHTPGSMVEDRQYQIDVKNIRLNTGFWPEMERLLQSYQPLDTASPRTGSQPNPAVLWNQGQNPENVASSNLTLYPVLMPFNMSVIFAPPIFFSNSPILICGSSSEINVLSEIKLLWTLNQLKLISSLHAEVSSCMISKLRMSHAVANPYFVVTKSTDEPSVRRDSGLESADGDSDVCSLKNADKSGSNTPVKVLYTIHEALSTIQSPSVFTDSSPLSAGGLTKRTKLNYIPVEMLLTAKRLSITLFKESMSDSEDLSSKETEIQPLLFISATEPHCFVKYYSDSYFCQASVFDFSLLFAKPNHKVVKSFPEESDFAFKFLETAECERSINGILPSFFTSKYSQNYSKQPKIEIELGRPIRLNLSKAVIDYVTNLAGSLSSNHKSTYVATVSQISGSNDSLSNDKVFESTIGHDPASSTSSESSSIRTILNNFSCISCNTQQLSWALYGPGRRKMIVSVEKMNCSLKIISLLNHSVDRLLWTLNMNSMILSLTRPGRSNAILLNPWSLLFSLTLSWEPWFHSCLKPLMQISVESNVFSINCCSETIHNFRQVFKEYLHIWEKFSSHPTNEKTPETIISEETTGKKQSCEEEQHYKDDLRAGAFQYLDQVSDLPSAYQVVFDKNGVRGAPSMSWRYPQPRCITKMEVSPVPFTTMQEKQPSKGGVDCVLEYYSDIHGQFIEYTVFSLSESKTQRVHLPSNAPLPVTASCWRVKLMPSEDSDNPLSDIRCLAGIIRIDSYYSPIFLPHIQASLSISSIQIEFWNEVKKFYPMPQSLNRYNLDGVVPPDHCCAKLSFEQSKIGFMFWENSMTAEIISTRPRLDVLNYASLTMQCVVEPFLLRASCYFLKEDGNNPHLSVVTNNVNVWVGPAVIQSLNIAMQLYHQNQNDEQNHLQVLLTPFVICNNTNEAIKFGQTDVSEEIVLQPLQCHMYSWRSTRNRPCLRVTLASSTWLWSEPVSVIDYKTSFLTLSAEDGQSVIIIITVKNISPNSTQIIIDGQLQLCNLTGRLLECALVSKRDGSHVDNRLVTLSPGITPPSILQRPAVESCVRLSFPSASDPGSSVWSGFVPIHPQEGLQKSYWLVKVPLKTRTQYRSIWCRAIWDSIKINDTIFYRTLVVLTPLVSIKSLLPCKASVEIETPGWEPVSAMVLGCNVEHELDCPGTTHDNHELSFQLEGRLPASSPSVSISYSSLDGRTSPDPTSLPPFDDLLEEIRDSKSKTENANLEWPFVGEEFNNFDWVQSDQPDTITHIKAKFKTGKYYCNSLLVELKPWALLVNTCGAKVSFRQNNILVCSVANRSVIAPPLIESTFQLSIDVDSKSYNSLSLQLSSDQSFYIPRISGLIPLTGSVSVTINQDKFVSFLTISSSQTEDIRVIHISSSYLISNNSSYNILISPVIVKNSSKSAKLSVTSDLFENSMNLPADVAGSQMAEPLIRWLKVKADKAKDNASELYLILQINGFTSCPLLVSSVIDKQIVPVIFSSSSLNSEWTPAIGVTAQTKNNQTFLSIWDQPYPDVVIYNNTKLTLLFTRISEQKQPILETPNWMWMLTIAPNTAVNYFFPNAASNFFSLAIDDNNIPRDWSESVRLSPCISRLISLPNHKHDVKLTITKCAYLMKVFIESASQSEVSARDIRLRLAQSRFSDSSDHARNVSSLVDSEEIEMQNHDLQRSITSSDEFSRREKIFPVCAEIHDDRTSEKFYTPLHSELASSSNFGAPPMTSSEIISSDTLHLAEEQLFNSLGLGLSAQTMGSKSSVPSQPSMLSEFQSAVGEESAEGQTPLNFEELKKQKSIEDKILRSSQISSDSANLNATCFMAGLSLTFIKDDFVCAEKEVAALSFDHICFLVLPLSVADGKSNELLVNLSIGGIQLDNQEFNQGGYDFPVVIVKTINDKQQIISAVDISKRPAQWLVEEARMKGQIAMFVNSVMDVSTYNTWVIEDISMNISSFQAYIEDTYFLFLKKYLLTLSKWTSTYTLRNPKKKDEQSNFVGTHGKHLQLKGTEESETKKKPNIKKSHARNVTSPDDNVEKTSDISYNVSSNGSGMSAEKTKEFISSAKSIVLVNQQKSVESMDDVIFEFIIEESNGSDFCTDIRKSIIVNSNSGSSGEGVPVSDDLYAFSREVAVPLRLRSLKISPVNILVSVHTSTRFYIALDHSPLSFSEFKRFNLVTSHFRLGSAISLHYFLNAIYGTGWALGALELWGAPGGLARSVGAGVRDLITLPITGSMEQGARGFLVGVAHGCASLMKHVTAGTLSSVTKFAASWARTLDRLTLEPEDLRHAEELRRLRPQGVAQGFVQGLTEFGISLLGAIGGLAHHPLQYAIRDNPDRSLVNSIGLGLVGVITRPLSGAAELVALTGEGLLSGVGWNQAPKAKQQLVTQNRIICTNSSLKYTWKLLNTFEELLHSAEVTHQMDHNTFKHVMLVLTKKSLHIFDCDFDKELKVYPLEELFETENECDPTLISFRIKSQEKQLEEMSQARVLEFVRDSRRLAGQQSSSPPLTEYSFEETVSFFINPQSRDHLIVFFNLAKRHNQNKGFSVL